MPGDTGMLIPKTRDGRVLFAIPWHGMLLVGTTDVEQKEADFDPKVSDAEIDFMIETASGYLEKPITRADVKASFAGLRPLFNPQATGSAGSTAKVSREHAVIPEFGNMITVTGGKWTAYRKMAEHAMLVATPSPHPAASLRHEGSADLLRSQLGPSLLLRSRPKPVTPPTKRSFSSPSTPATTSSPARPRTCSFAVCASAR